METAAQRFIDRGYAGFDMHAGALRALRMQAASIAAMAWRRDVAVKFAESV
jgi:hypothetical protein